MKKITTVFMFLFLTISATSYAQVKIGNNPNTIDPNSLLELESSTKGFLAPRMALNSISSVSPLTGTVPNGMLVYSIGGSLTNGFYVWNGTQWLSVLTSQNSRNNYVLVKSAADFPAPVAGVITLVAGTLYEINGTIVLTNKIDLNNSTILGKDRANDVLLYTPATGELFTGSNGGNIFNLTVVVPTPGAKVFNIDAAGSITKSLLLQLVYIFGCDNVGLIKGFGSYVIFQSVAFTNNTNGITFQDIGNLVEGNLFFLSDNHNTYQKLVGAFGHVLIAGGENSVTSAFSAKAFDVSGITSINGGEIKATFFTGDGTYLVGALSNKWEAEATGINTQKDDVSTGNIYVSTSVQTVIASINVPVKVLGTTTAANLFRVTSPANNRLTYTGTKTKRFQVICSLTTSFISAVSNKFFTFYIAKNGVILPESQQKVKLINNTDQSSLTLSCTVSLNTNDFVEVWVENNTDGTDITIQSLNLAIK